jgi:hypothetical protein
MNNKEVYINHWGFISDVDCKGYLLVRQNDLTTITFMIKYLWKQVSYTCSEEQKECIARSTYDKINQKEEIEDTIIPISQKNISNQLSLF